MKRVELLQKLSKTGAIFVRHGNKHDVYIQPKTNKESAIPHHADIDEFTAKSIIRKLS